MNCSSPGSSVHGILQARILEWVATSFSNVNFSSRSLVTKLCPPLATPQTVACHVSLFMGFPRQEHWSGLPFLSPMHENEKWKCSRSVVSDSSRPHGLQPTRLFRPWDFPGKSTGVGCHCLLRFESWVLSQLFTLYLTSAMQMTPPLWQKMKRNSKASWWKWKWRVKKLA